MGNGQVSKLVVVVTFVLYIMAFGFALGAQFKRSKVTDVTHNADGTQECHYKGNTETGLAFAALIFLLAAQVFVNFTTRCLCCGANAYKPGAARTCAIIAFIISWTFFALAFLFLLGGAVADRAHTKAKVSCHEWKGAIFAVGAAFTFLNMLMSELYYVLLSLASISSKPYAPGPYGGGSTPSVGLATYA